jgi:hypothetical protein
MTRLRWLVALAAIITLVLASSVLAGSTRPAGGDPDIWERCKINTSAHSVKNAALQADPPVTIDLVVLKVNVTQREAGDSSKRDISKLQSISVRTKSSR